MDSALPTWWDWIPADEWNHPLGSASVVELPDTADWIAAVGERNGVWTFKLTDGDNVTEGGPYASEEEAQRGCEELYRTRQPR